MLQNSRHIENGRVKYTIKTVCPEFTSVCPKTGQADFGRLTISYVPQEKCVELKSLKIYLQQYRNQGIFYEYAANRILDDLVAAVRPRRMTLTAAFTPLGGIAATVTATFEARKSPNCTASAKPWHTNRTALLLAKQ